MHVLDGDTSFEHTYCGWARVWAEGEWPVNNGDKVVSCLECLVTPKPA